MITFAWLNFNFAFFPFRFAFFYERPLCFSLSLLNWIKPFVDGIQY